MSKRETMQLSNNITFQLGDKGIIHSAALCFDEDHKPFCKVEYTMGTKKEHTESYQLKKIDGTLTQIGYAIIAGLDVQQVEWLQGKLKEVNEEYGNK